MFFRQKTFLQRELSVNTFGHADKAQRWRSIGMTTRMSWRQQNLAKGSFNRCKVSLMEESLSDTKEKLSERSCQYKSLGDIRVSSPRGVSFGEKFHRRGRVLLLRWACLKIWPSMKSPADLPMSHRKNEVSPTRVKETQGDSKWNEGLCHEVTMTNNGLPDIEDQIPM